MEEINEDQYVRDEFNLSESKTFSFSSIDYFLLSLFNCLSILFYYQYEDHILFLLLKRKKNWHEFINLLIHSYLLTRSPNTLIRVHMQ